MRASLAFKIPSSAFQPKPDVTSALVVVDFPPHRPVLDINECHMRTVLRAAFQQRRKMLRQVQTAHYPKPEALICSLSLPANILAVSG